MCGFVGFVDNEKYKDDILYSMMKSINHRGPDSEGSYIDNNVALGFKRLSIIDINSESQPLFNEDNSIAVVFNGEIYNYKELSQELFLRGHDFRTKTDSEVLVHLYEEFGYDMLQKLRGMFAFAIWDIKKERLFMARDFFGIKPLYYTKMEDSFIFGSEIKSFLFHPNFKKTFNNDALNSYLTFQYVPTRETFFKDVYTLAPAHYLVYENNTIEINKYWEPKFSESDKSLGEVVDDLENIIEESIELHKISDVEVGSYLSSGVDSSYICSRANVSKTFTVGFDNNNYNYNEISYAKEFSNVLDIFNINKIINKDDFWDSLPMLQYYMDEPLADPAAIALYFLGKEASKYVKVVLSGEGADEFFGGYNIYREPLEFKAYTALPIKIRKVIGNFAKKFPKGPGVNFLVRKSKNLEERYVGNAYIFDEDEKEKLLVNPSGVKPIEITKKLFDEISDKDDVTKMQYIDINTWLVNDILLKADKMSMANSLELRVPYLDKEVFNVASTMKQEYKVKNKVTKYAFRKLAEKHIPIQVANKKKLGFPVPIRVWLKEDKYYNKVKKKFSESYVKEFFNVDYLYSLLEEHRNDKYDNSRKIWTIYTFLLWYEVFFIKDIVSNNKVNERNVVI